MSTLGKFNLNTIEFLNTGDNFATATVADGTITFSSDNVTITPNNLVQLKGVSDPLLPQDAVTKKYVDNLVGTGITWKDAGEAASTADVNIASAPATIDGVTPSSGTSRILLKDQSSASENGIYIWNGTGSAMTRSSGATTNDQASGAAIFIYEGTANGDKAFVCTTDGPVDFGASTAWAQFGAGAGSAGNIGDVQYSDGAGGFSAEAAFNYTSGSDTLTIGLEGASGTLTGANSTTGGVAGGALALLSGDGNTTSSGGTLSITGGIGGATSGTGGAVEITGGIGGAPNGAGGQISVRGGGADGTQTGGLAILEGGHGGDGATGNGGAVNISGGESQSTNGTGGAIVITTGIATGTGSTGNITISTPNSTTTSGSNPGDIGITCGNGGAGSAANGGVITITAGVGDGAGVNGNVLIPTSTASTSKTTGALVITGGIGVSDQGYATKWKTASDSRIKTNIKRLSNSLNIINKINGYEYDWKPECSAYRGPNEPKNFGVIAQQLEEIGLENLVDGVGDEEKAVDYNGLTPILIEGIKELATKTDFLATKVEHLERENGIHKMMNGAFILGVGISMGLHVFKFI